MKLLRILAASAALSMSFVASAQYQWIDGNGRHVFSDRPPPASIPAKNIVSEPRINTVPGPLAAESPDTLPVAPAASAPTASGTDAELQKRVDELAAADAEKKQESTAANEQARAEGCKRARNYKLTLDSGKRIGQLNDKGETVILDDAQRAAESQRASELIASLCG